MATPQNPQSPSTPPFQQQPSTPKPPTPSVDPKLPVPPEQPPEQPPEPPKANATVGQSVFYTQGNQQCPAIVTRVNEDGSVNLTIFPPEAPPHPRRSTEGILSGNWSKDLRAPTPKTDKSDSPFTRLKDRFDSKK